MPRLRWKPGLHATYPEHVAGKSFVGFGYFG